MKSTGLIRSFILGAALATGAAYWAWGLDRFTAAEVEEAFNQGVATGQTAAQQGVVVFVDRCQGGECAPYWTNQK